jgi:hypothetical protein
MRYSYTFCKETITTPLKRCDKSFEKYVMKVCLLIVEQPANTTGMNKLTVNDEI